MATKRRVFLGIGCVLLLGGIFLAVLTAIALKPPGLPKAIVLAVNLDGEIVEIAAEDPFAEAMGDTPLSLRDLRAALVRAAEDDRVLGVRLRIDSWGGGLATAQEIRSLLERVRVAGKWTAAYMDTAGEFMPGNMAYYVASACDEISINPMGDVNLIGFSVRTPFIRGALDKMGVRPEFPGRGRYKSARFMYTHTAFTPAAEEMMDWLFSSLMDQLVTDIASSRGLESAEVQNIIDNAPYFGQEALDIGLVDRLEDWNGFTTRLTADDDGPARVVGFNSYLKRDSASESGPKIAVVTAVGGIMRGTSRKSINPMLGGNVMGAETIAKAFRDVRKLKGVKAVVFRVDSPGGSAVASEIIRQEMVRTAEQMPIIVSMGNYAASGGYWVTCGAQKIVAYPATLTGSIGVFAGHFNLDGLWGDKLGVTFGRLDYGKNAAIYGEVEDWTDDQRAIVERMLDRIYDTFLEHVAESRDSTPEEIHKIAEGRVFTGVQGLENGLVDKIGGFDDALVLAREAAGLAPDARIKLVDYPKVKPWWQEMLEKGKDQETAINEASDMVNTWWSTGVAQTPGVVWMPPIIIQ